MTPTRRMTPTLGRTGGRSVLRMERVLRHPPERVWRMVSEPDELATWFPSRVTIDLRVGGPVGFEFGADGVVTDLEPPRLLAFTWDADHLRFEIHPDGDGSRLVLVHTFDDRAGAASFAAGWESCFGALVLALSGRAGRDPGIDHVALHERFVEEFGLDAGVAESAPGGWRVRFERQLTRPAEVAWKALAAGPPWPGADVPVVEEGTALEHDVPDGRVRWELGEGTGHGARLLVTWTGRDAEGRDAALAGGPERVAELVARMT